MNWLDWLLAVTLAGSIVSGFTGGFARVGIGFAASLAAFWGGMRFYPAAAAYVLPHVHGNQSAANLVGFLLVFAAIMVLGSIVTYVVGLIFRWTGLTFFDRLLGAVFGLVRGVVIGVVIILAMVAFAPVLPSRALVESRLAPYVVESARTLAGLTPEPVREAFARNYDRLKQRWQETWQERPRRLPSAAI